MASTHPPIEVAGLTTTIRILMGLTLLAIALFAGGLALLLFERRDLAG